LRARLRSAAEARRFRIFGRQKEAKPDSNNRLYFFLNGSSVLPYITRPPPRAWEPLLVKSPFFVVNRE
jgi:hypothetical protein